MAVIDSMELDPDIVVAEENYIHDFPEAARNNAWAVGEPQDYQDQPGYDEVQAPLALLHSRGAGVRVAVVDSGVDRTHPALAGRLLAGYDFVDMDADPTETAANGSLVHGHGTHVAGIIAAVAPEAQLLPVRVLDVAGQSDAWTILQAVRFALDPDGDPHTDDGAQVINLSLGTPERTETFDTITKLASCSIVELQEDPDLGGLLDPGFDDDKIRCANSSGAVVVAAAGNLGSKRRFFPAGEGAYGLLAVTATDGQGRLADFANYGSWVHVAAPGVGITSSVPGGLFATWSGTSMAAPFVAGIAALVSSVNPSLTPPDLARRIERNAMSLCREKIAQVDALAALLDIRPDSHDCR